MAEDVCDILEMSNSTEVLRSLDEDERSSLRITEDTSPNGGNPKVNVINEPGLYKLMFKSRKEEAKEFTRWVTHEVLPKIREMGAYRTKAISQSEREERTREHEQGLKRGRNTIEGDSFAVRCLYRLKNTDFSSG